MAVGTNSFTTLAAGVIGAGVSMARPAPFEGRSTLTRASKRNVAAAANPRPSPIQFSRKRFCCFGRTPAVAVPLPATSSASPISIRAASSGDAGRGRSFFNSASSSEKSFMDDKVLFERRERVAITRRRRVLRNAERFRDLGKSELAPNLHDQDLALF